MLEQSSNTLRFWAFYTNSGVRATGLTVTVDVWRNTTQIVTDAACTELGDGQYYYDLASGSVTVEGDYRAVFTTVGTVDVTDLIAAWWVDKAGIERLDASISGIRDAVAAQFHFSLPEVRNHKLTLVSGDDYAASIGTQISFTTDLTVLTGKTITFYIRRSDGTTLSVNGTVTSADAGYFELTRTQTLTLNPNSHLDYQVEVVSSGLRRTIEEGKARIVPKL